MSIGQTITFSQSESGRTNYVSVFCHKYIFQNLNKQAYDLAKALLKRTAQAIEPYITNVSEDLKYADETEQGI